MRSKRNLGILGGCLIAALCNAPSSLAQPIQRRPAASLSEFSDSLRDLTEKVSGSVVQVVTSGYGILNDAEDAGVTTLTGKSATGAGVILSAEGLIMTNAHVVEGARHIRVRQSGGSRNMRSFDATLVGLDRRIDLALLHVDATDLKPLPMADWDGLKQGQLVLAFGSPMGLDNSVSMGVISSVGRQLSPDDPRIYIQTDAPINPGNSGGPLVDVDGRLVGLNTFILSQSGGSEGLGFAIPGNVIAYAFKQFKRDGHLYQGQVGLNLRTISEPLGEGLGLEPYSGVLIEDMVADGPAAGTGLAVGDVVLRMGDREVHNVRDFALGFYRYSIGDKVELQVLRNKQTISFVVPVVEREDPQRLADLVDPERDAVPQLGWLMLPVDNRVKQILGNLRSEGGILVAARVGTSRYVGDELQQADVIYSMNGTHLTTVDELRSALQRMKPGSPAVLQVEREGKLLYLVLESD